MADLFVQPMPQMRDTSASGTAWRLLAIGLIAFLTLVDLFATQAILPILTHRYQVTPAAMGLAVNACTLGMAISSFVAGLFSPRIDRRAGTAASLATLAVLTFLLANAPNLAVFAALRVLQGLCMAAAFTLTLAHLSEQCSPITAGSAFASYITGNVASNLLGRLLSAGLADAFGLTTNFYVFALLNVCGALLARSVIGRLTPMPVAAPIDSPLEAVRAHWRNPRLRAAFGIGFCVLFAFIGAFTFVNFVLVRPPLSLGMMQIGLVYLVFLPAIITTPLAGKLVVRVGARPAIWASLGTAQLGVALMLSSRLGAVLAGMVLVGAGTFFAQAVATSFVGQTAGHDRGVASGLYLAGYFAGGIVGTAVLGQLFDRFGWTACVAGIAVALTGAAGLVVQLTSANSQDRLGAASGSAGAG